MEYDEIDDKWLKNMREIYQRYEKFDFTSTNSVKCIIFFISKKNEITEVVKKNYKLNKNSITNENVIKIVQEYSNKFKILDIFQTYMPYDHENIEKENYNKEPLKIKNVTNNDNIYYPNTTIYMKSLNNIIIFCKENTNLSPLTKRINIKYNKKTRKNKQLFLNF